MHAYMHDVRSITQIPIASYVNNIYTHAQITLVWTMISFAIHRTFGMHV